MRYLYFYSSCLKSMLKAIINSYMFLLATDYWEMKGTAHKGRGVFAKKDIEPVVIIGDYVGKLINEDEEYDLQEKYGFYSLSYADDTSVWPDIKKPGVYLINHSCTPNTYMYSYQGHTLYFALRKIFAGEELTVSYLMSPADEDDDPCEHDCHCKSELCTGTMHMTQESFDAWKKFDDEMVKDVKLPPIVYGKDLLLLDAYPENIADHPIFPLYGAAQHEVLVLENKKLPSQQKLRKLIRQTGQKLFFKELGITVLGIADDQIISKKT